MSDDVLETFVTGDAVTIPFSEIGDEMAGEQIDLPPNVASELMANTVGNIQLANARQRDAAGTASHVLQAYQAQAFGEVGTLEGRAVSGVNNTDLGAPSGRSGS